MVTALQNTAAHKLSAARIRSLKDLGRHIDAQEGDAIRARGRAIFRRHKLARDLVANLRTRRLELGLSLAEVAARTGIAKPNLSRLENSQHTSPTLETLHRYASALGMKMRVELVGNRN
jgi:DNA-binding phage protein